MTQTRGRTRPFSASALKAGALALVLASAGALFASSATADPTPQAYGYGGGRGGGGGEITLYDGRNFTGDAISLNRAEPKLNEVRFNDRPSSLSVRGGAWEVCEFGEYGGKCVVVDRDVPDLKVLGMNDNISSIRPAGYGSGGGGGWGRDDDRGGWGKPGGGRDRDRDDGFGRQEGYTGEYAVFFPRPLQYGRPLEAYQGAADLFCKRQGFPDAVYARNNSGIVTDILCRKR